MFQVLNFYDQDISFPSSPVKLLYQKGGASTGLVQKSDNLRPLLQRESPLTRSFPICQEVLNISQTTRAFHGISPPIFHPSLIATVQQTFLPLFCVPLFQQYHSSRIDGVLKFGDDRSLQDLPNSNELSVGFSVGSRNCLNLSISFPSFEKLLFCTDKIESSEWLKLVPRLSIDDCFEMHLPH